MITDKDLAYKHLPHVIHGVRSKWKDQISAIYFGDLIQAHLEPHVYFEVVRNQKTENFLIVYNYFHRKDYSLGKGRILNRLDSHHLDFEGVVKCISPENEVLWTCTRSHYRLLFQAGDSKIVYIEPESHSITPDNGFRGWQNQVVIAKNLFKMVDMKVKWKDFELHIWPMFRKYKIDQWRDWGDTRLDREFGPFRMAGLLEKNPDKFYKYALKRRIMKGL